MEPHRRGDLDRWNLKPRRNLLDLAPFVRFFPQLVVGPIVRASAFLMALLPTPLADLGFEA